MNAEGTGAANGSRRLGWSLAASCAAHAAMAMLAFRAAVTLEPPRAVVFLPVSLVSLPGGGGGARGPEAPGPAAETPPAPPPPVATSTPPASPARPRVVRRPKPAPAKPADAPVEEAASETAAVTGAPRDTVAWGGTGAIGDGSARAGGGGGGGGDGSGGDGTGGARVAYGTNPLPPYPLAARRLGHEGVVFLDVLVSPDGRAAEVAVSRSSGHPTLDESAMSTVRERWRFVPARRDGHPVASRVVVPIRFRLDEVRGG